MLFEHSPYLHDNLSLEFDGKGSSVKTKIHNIGTINLLEISTVHEIVKIREEWKKLFLNCPEATPFQSWEWNYAMIKEFSSSENPKVIIGYNRKNEIVGLAPLKLTCYKFPGIKILEFIDNNSSDYLDFLVEDEYKYTFTAALFDFLKNSKDWSILNLINLRKETKDLISRYLPVEISRQVICPCVYLPDTMQEYENEVHRRELKSIKRKLRKLLPQNRVMYVVRESHEILEEDINSFIELHQKRQNFKGERGKFCTKALKERFHEISKLLSDAGILRIEMLKIDSQIAAINYILVWNNKKYNYLSGMDPAFSQFKPGKILIYYMIEDAINKSYNVFDFLRGAEDYKYFWTNKEIQLYSALYSRSKMSYLLWKKAITLKSKLKKSKMLKKSFLTLLKLFYPDQSCD